jgi:hypothetical protein
MRAEPSKHIKRLLREWSGRAYAEELRRALLPLGKSFDRWRAGDLDSFELSERIHRFHQGPNRELFNRYNSGNTILHLIVARAVFAGILDREQMPEELLEYLAPSLSFYEAHYADSDQGDGEDDEQA